MHQDPIANIAHLIETKSHIKQETYRHLCKTFKQLKEVSKATIEKINQQVKVKDKEVELRVINVSDHEFHIKLAGDLLIFLMHTNIVTLQPEHGFNKSKYVEENPMRKYLGQINVYNFMADSLLYNRLNDPGYLVGRLSLNYEKYFLVEGENQLSFMFGNFSNKPLTVTELSIFVQLVLSQTIETDLVMPPFPEIKYITLNEKLIKSQALGGGYKIGFQLNENQNIE